MTPIMHYNPEGCDDNRLDMRPMIYATNWEYQFGVIEERVKQIKHQLVRKNSGKSLENELKEGQDSIIEKK